MILTDQLPPRAPRPPTGGAFADVVRSPLIRYVLRRVLQAVFVLWAAFTLAFLLLYWLPGDAVLARLASGEAVEVDAAQEAALRAEYGLDAPMIVQYLRALGNAVTGDFGLSIRTNEPVFSAIGAVLPDTLVLLGLALVLGVVGGSALALAATSTRMRWLRESLTSLPAIGISMPTFWVGLLLIFFVAFRLGWLPPAGNRGFATVILPAITLALPVGAGVSQILAKSMRDALRAPYIEAARAKGVGRRAVHLSHALPNASLPVVTMIGLVVSNLIAGSAVVETVFSRQGFGRLAVEAVIAQDLPVILGIVVVAAGLFVVVNLLVDLTYPILDPRISLTAATRAPKAVHGDD